MPIIMSFSIAFSIFCVSGALFGGGMVQSNTIAESVAGAFSAMSGQEHQRMLLIGSIFLHQTMQFCFRLKFLLNVKDNNTPFPVEIKIPSSNIDVEFKEGDTITVTEKLNGEVIKWARRFNINYSKWKI